MVAGPDICNNFGHAPVGKLHNMLCASCRCTQHVMQPRQFLDGNCATEFDGCGQYLWVCHVGVAMVPDGNPKKLEPM